MKPLIAVGGRRLAKGKVERWPDRGAAVVPDQFIDALHRAGAREAILMPVAIEPEEAREILEPFDGLLLTGGGDISPRHYGVDPHDHLEDVHEERDAFDIYLLRAAIDRDMPVLAVCRGMQVLNVAMGGTLHHHLPAIPELDAHERDDGTDRNVVHPMRVEPGTRTGEAVGAETFDVASSHHQGVDRLGTGLIATGWSPDGLIEAVELDRGWVVGVQWHPEALASQGGVDQRLFDVFVDRCRATADAR